MKRIFFLLALSITALSGAISCKTGGNSRRVTVAVSIPPQATLLHEIGGDSIEIVTLMQAEANPEAFEISVNDMRAVNDASLYMKIGNLPFEETLAERIGASNPRLRFVDVSAGVEPVYGTHSHGSHNHDIADPHTWTSVANLKIIAANMLATLSEADPANREYYTANCHRLIGRLDSLDRATTDRIGQSGCNSFLIWHPSLSYFARDYGLRQIAVGQDNKEMTPGQLRDVIHRAKADSATVMFMQRNFDTRQAESLAHELDAEIVTINPLDADIFNQFNIITDALTRH